MLEIPQTYQKYKVLGISFHHSKEDRCIKGVRELGL